MHLTRVLLTGVVLAGLAACDSDPVSKEVAPEPFASVRWVNAVPDTVAMDYRIVDYPSNASEPNLAFRASSGNWRNLPPGPHHIRVFFTNTTEAGTDVSVVSQVFVDTTFVFEVGKKYTILHYGFAKAGASPKQRLILIPEELPSVAAGNVALRSINAAPALGPVDVYAIAADTLGGAAVSGTPIAANLAPAGVSSWVNKPVVTTGTYRVAATAPSSTALLVEALAPVGAPADDRGCIWPAGSVYAAHTDRRHGHKTRKHFSAFFSSARCSPAAHQPLSRAPTTPIRSGPPVLAGRFRNEARGGPSHSACRRCGRDQAKTTGAVEEPPSYLYKSSFWSSLWPER